MSKDNPQVLRSDVDELFDKNRTAIANLIEFARDKDVEITLTVNSKGVANLQVFERTKNYALYKSVTESPNAYKYQENVQKI